MTTLIEMLNSGELHARERGKRPSCVDSLGNIHGSPERAKFVDWKNTATQDDVEAEYEARYIPSH